MANSGNSPTTKAQSKLRILQQLSRAGVSQTRAGWNAAWIVLSTGLVATLLVSWITYRFEGKQKTAEFDRLSDHLAQVAETNFYFPLEVFHSLPPFFESSEEVTRSEFQTFVTGAVDRHRSVIFSFQWIPCVPLDQREEVVRQARADGLTTFEIREYLDNGGLEVAGERPFYMPVLFEYQYRLNTGIDLTTDAARADAIERALTSGTIAMSRRLMLSDQAGDEVGVALYCPIEESKPIDQVSRCRGLVAVTLLLRPIMDLVLEGNYMEGTRVVLTDDGAEPSERLLYENVRGADRSTESSDLAWSGTFPMADRAWTIRVTAEPDSEWVTRTASWFVLASGVVLSVAAALASMAFGTIAGLRQRVEAAVQLGQYKLEEKIGEGGMGQVYRASHAMLRRPTAVKLLRSVNSSGAELSRFEREVQLTSQLVHPNTIVIFDYGRTPDGTFYYAMEYLDGADLNDAVEFSGAMPEARVIHVLLQVCGSLNEAHLAGMVHRDIKPPNIMLCQRGGQADIVKVLDFGLVKDLGLQGAGVTQASSITGTPLYMSPEAIDDPIDVDPRSDLYALGAVGYFLLAGGPVFSGDSPIRVMHDHIHSPPESISERLGKPISSDLEAVIMACLQKDRANRPQSAAELAASLRKCSSAGQWSPEQAREWWARYDSRDSSSAETRSTKRDSSVDLTVEIDFAERS